MRGKKILRYLTGTLAVLLAVYGLFVAVIFYMMHQPPDRFGAFMAHVPGQAFLVLPFETLWLRARAGHLAVGDTAPDFHLRTADKTSRVRLSSFRGSRPVALVFGSYT